MSNMSAAQLARMNAALDKPFVTDSINTTYREALADGTIAYGRIRDIGEGKRKYGVVLASDLLEDPYYSPYFDAPKFVVDNCPNIITNF